METKVVYNTRTNEQRIAEPEHKVEFLMERVHTTHECICVKMYTSDTEYEIWRNVACLATVHKE